MRTQGDKGVTTKARRRALGVARFALGPAARRVRRELVWRRPGVNIRVDRRDSDDYPHVVASHSTPLYRPLSGVDHRLQQNKAVNLRLAADRLDGVILRPGVTLSFWHEVGKPSRRRGFLDGLVLSHGELAVGIGGGLCQMTNLLYWMTLHTPLTIVERWRHSYDVFPDVQRTQPFGSGATCAWPLLDLAIENRTPSSYRLSVLVTATHLVGSWSGAKPPTTRYEIEERGHRFTHERPGVYVRRNQLWRLAYAGTNGAPSEEMIAENAALMMYAPFLPPGQPNAFAAGPGETT